MQSSAGSASIVPLWMPRRGPHPGTRAPTRSCRQRGSIALALRLIVERGVPLELAHQVEQALLLSACDEFLERPGDGRLLRALAADLQRAIDQIGINRKIRRHV